MNKKKTKSLIAEDKLVLQLYVSGMSPKSMEAIENIKHLCEEHLKDVFELEIIDIYKNPELLSQQHIVFSPSLVKQAPLPKKVLIGTFSNIERVKKALGINLEDTDEG